MQPVGQHLGALAQGFARFRLVGEGFGGGADVGAFLHGEQKQVRRQGAVEQLVTLLRPQAHLFPQLGVAGEDAGFPAREFGFQALAQMLVEQFQGFYFPQALAVGRVGDHQAGFQGFVGGLLQGRQLFAADAQPVIQLRLNDVVLRGANDRKVGIIPPYLGLRPGQTRPLAVDGFLAQLQPEVVAVAQPVFKTKARSPQAGGNVGGDHGRFHQKSARAAHGVDKGSAPCGDLGPAGPEQNPGGEVFLHGGGALFGAVAAPVQALSGQVQTDGDPAFVQAGIDSNVGLLLADRGALAGKVPQPVDNGVFDFERAELGVADGTAGAQKVHYQGTLRAQMFLPGNTSGAIVEAVLIPHRKVRQGKQDFIGQAGPEAGTVGEGDVPGKSDACHGFFKIFGSERCQLLIEQALQTFGAGSEKRERCSHGQGGLFVKLVNRAMCHIRVAGYKKRIVHSQGSFLLY